MMKRPFRGMGELPQGLSEERGETWPPNAPVGFPPLGSEYVPTSSPVGGSVDTSRIGNASLWQVISFNAGTSPQKVQDVTARKYLLIQNKSTTGVLYVGFGYVPNENNGIVLLPGGFFEPLSYPVNEIWVIADMRNTNGILIYGT